MEAISNIAACSIVDKNVDAAVDAKNVPFGGIHSRHAPISSCYLHGFTLSRDSFDPATYRG